MSMLKETRDKKATISMDFGVGASESTMNSMLLSHDPGEVVCRIYEAEMG
jgi:hypothetical protein